MRCAGPFKVDGAAVEIDGSIGWAVFPDDGATAEDLLAHADGQMYATKRDTSEETLVLRRGVDAGVVRDVETALERNELLVVYQPIIDLATGSPHSAEALIRRVLPDGGLVPPAEFVPHVERTPLVRELTFLVVADALGSAEHWAKAGHRLGVSINIPYRLLDDPQFADGLASMLSAYDLSTQSAHAGDRACRAGRRRASSTRRCSAASTPWASDFPSTTEVEPHRSPRSACSRSTS